jgi:tuberculosinol/isotuberculosinol synthase
MLEHPPQDQNSATSYLDISTQRHIELYSLLFDHGIDTLLTPIFGPDLAERGDDYMQMAAAGLTRLATHPDFLDFYTAYQVRVRFYGDHRKFFGQTPYAYLSDLFEEATQQTLVHSQYRLFFGVCANDATETTAKLAIRHYAECGCAPDKQTIIEMYYGEYVSPVDLFIGFDRFCAFDMPLLATGNEDLYFSISPSPYLTERQLRDILYDHLYTRRAEETDYSDMSNEDWTLMKDFYHANLEKTLGIGARQEHGRYWYPLPAVQLPEGFGASEHLLKD